MPKPTIATPAARARVNKAGKRAHQDEKSLKENVGLGDSGRPSKGLKKVEGAFSGENVMTAEKGLKLKSTAVSGGNGRGIQGGGIAKRSVLPGSAEGKKKNKKSKQKDVVTAE